MANKISITVAVQNRASKPLKDVGKSVKGLSTDIKNFNRDLFATTALIGTFAVGFKKAIDIGKVGAEYDYLRNQFYNTFGPEYFRTLQQVTRGTADAMTLMQESVRAYTMGLDKEEVKKAFGISVFAAKRLGTSTEDAMKQIISSLNSGRMEFLNMLAPSLKWSDRFQMINKVIGQTGKGFIGASIKGKVFRKMLLDELYAASLKNLDVEEDYLEILMQTSAGFKSLKEVVGDFVARALAPLAKTVGTRLWSAFSKLDQIIAAVNNNTKNIRNGVVDLIKSFGFALSSLTTFWGSFKVLGMILGTLGMPLKTFIGAVVLFTSVLKAAKGDNQSWLEFLSHVGTALKFLYEALMSYRDGWIHISGDVFKRFQELTPATKDFLLNLSQGLALVKEATLGVVQGFSWMFDKMSKLLRVFGLFDGKTYQLAKGWATFANVLGRVAGVLGALYGVKLAVGAVGGVFGKLGGALGMKRGETPFSPLYVSDVSSKAGMAVGAFSKLYGMDHMKGLFIESLKKAFPTFARWGAGLAGIGGGISTMIGSAVTAIIPFLPMILAAIAAAGAVYFAYKSIKDAMNDPGKTGMSYENAGTIQEASGSWAKGTGAKGVLKRQLRESEYGADSSEKVQKQFEEAMRGVGAGTLDADRGLLEKAMADKVLTQEEMLDVLKSIRDNTRGDPVNPKMWRGRMQ